MYAAVVLPPSVNGSTHKNRSWNCRIERQSCYLPRYFYHDADLNHIGLFTQKKKYLCAAPRSL